MILKNAGRFFCFLILWPIAAFGQHEQNPDSDKVLSSWLKLASEYRFQEPDSSRFYCRKIISAARASGKKDMEAEALRITSISYEAQGNYKEALEYGQQSLKLRRETGDEKKIANTLNSVGIIYDQQGNFYEALKYYNEAFDIYHRLKDDEHLAMMNVNLGILFKSQGQYDQVIRHYRDAYSIYKRLKLPAETAFCEANLGSVFYYTRQYDSCVYYSLKAEKALLVQKNLQFRPVALANAGIGFLAQHKTAEARKYLEEALQAHRKYGNKKETAFVLIHMARLHQETKQYAEALELAKEAKKIAEEIRAPQQLMEASRLLSELYARREDYFHAYQSYVQYSSVKDTLFEQQKTKEITNHQIRYETASKEQEIVLLTQKNTIQQLDIRERNLYLLVSLLLLAVVSLTAWFIYRKRKARELQLKSESQLKEKLLKAEAENTLQQDRLRISRELHDNIGAQLTFIKSAVDMVGNVSGSNDTLIQIKEILRDTIRDLRNTVWLINKPAVTIEEWMIRLREYYRKTEKTEVIHDRLEGEERLLSSQKATALFRIIQEAVNNSLKHAHGTHVLISVDVTEECLRITVEDDGQGFEAETATGGFGMENMRHHAGEAGGTIRVDSKKGGGTRIIAEVPL